MEPWKQSASVELGAVVCSEESGIGQTISNQALDVSRYRRVLEWQTETEKRKRGLRNRR